MSGFVPWNSQPLGDWATKHAPGKFLELDGLSTHYIEKGSGEPVILLHGFFFDTYMWNKNIDVFAERYKVYALDLWGFGYSSRESLDYGYPLYTQQLLKFMDALEIPKASLIGQSMGGGTIINFTVSNRDRVEKIILVDAAGMPNSLPIMARISNLPKVGEFLFGLNNNFIRRMTLGNNFLLNKNIITEEYFKNATRFHKIKGTIEVMLYITRKQFFDTLTEEIPLGKVFAAISDKEKGNKTSISHKDDKDKLEEYFFEILPDYDEDRVYASDIKKIVQWYNLLHKHDLLQLDEEANDEEE